jgi:ferredoxin-nitrite reductase
LLSEFTNCPGLFYVTPAQDGILSRLRIPGGILNSQQCRAIADIAEQYGGGYVDVTNRANLQVREISQKINAEVLKRLQDLGIGSSNTNVDHIRNIMTSPTAGIDPQELLDTRPFVQAWDNYIATNPALSGLSAKFSVCFDGGGKVSVRDRLNDITFAAVLVNRSVYFRLYLSAGAKGEPPKDTGILLSPDKCLSVLAALADVYLTHIDTNSKRKPRLREVVNTLGCENYLQEVQRLSFSSVPETEVLEEKPVIHENILQPSIKNSTHRLEFLGMAKESPIPNPKSQIPNPPNCLHIGIHPQRQPGLFYLGVVLPLGRLETRQIRGLADLAAKYGSDTLRLTPWQNLLLTDIPQESLTHVQNEIAVLGLDCSASNIKSALVACSGNKGCAASATDTKGDALVLAEYLENRVSLDCPVNIHFSGCSKSCAQHSKSDITLLGVSVEENNEIVEGYQVYVGVDDNEQKFGCELYQFVTVAEVPTLIERMLLVYKNQRLNPNETFGQFANRYEIAQLKLLCDCLSFQQQSLQLR